MHSLHHCCALQQPRIVRLIERWQHRMHVYLFNGVRWNDMQRLRRWLHHVPHMHPMHYGHALQRSRSIRDVGRCQDRMHVYLLDGVHWSDVQRLRRWLHQLRDMHAMHYGHALQRPRSVSDVGRCQDRMHVYVLDGVHWSDMQHLCRRLHHLPDMHAVHGGSTVQWARRFCYFQRREGGL